MNLNSKPANEDEVDATADLLDFEDQQIFTTLYLGTSHNPLTFIFDTGSPWSWVDSRVCKNCPYVPLYNEKTSTQFKMEPTKKIYQLNYGSGWVAGVQVEDLLCLAPETCSEDYKMMLVIQ